MSISAADSEPAPAAPWWRVAAPAVLGSWLAARALTLIGYLIARSDLVSGGRAPASLQKGLLSYDGGFYWTIALRGYPRCHPVDFGCVEARRFFPLFPTVGRVLAEVSPLSEANALLVVSNAAALAAGFAVWRLMRAWRDEATAAVAVWLVTLFPASSVLPMAYAESFALLLTAVAVAAVSARRTAPPGRAGNAAGFLGGLTRPTGIFVSGFAAVEAWRARRRGDGEASPRSTWLWVAAVAAPILGVAAFHVVLGALTGDAAGPVRIQGKLRNGFREPITRFLAAVWRTVSRDYRDGYNVVFAVLILALVALAATRYRREVPLSWTLTAAVGLWVALAANNIDSLGRYSLSVFPAWIAALTLLCRERRGVLVAVTAVSSLGYVWMTVTTMRSLVVP